MTKMVSKRSGAIKKIRAKFGRAVDYELLVFCSDRNIYLQIVDLKSGLTKVSVSTLKKGNKQNNRNISCGTELGGRLAEICKQKGIKNVSFNRAEKIFHGVVKAVADGFYEKLK